MLIPNGKKIESIAYALTFKCNCSCKHCFIECGPERKEVMDKNKLEKSLYNTAPFCNRIWLSGGEPTTVMDLLTFALNIINNIKKETGYPKEICIQTNGYWARDTNCALDMVEFFQEHGVTDIDISSNDIFHFEQMGDSTIPSRAAEICENSGYFNSIILAGSPTMGLKNLGRCRELKERHNIEIEYNSDCACFNDNYIIYPDFSVFNCKWALTNKLGYAYEKNIYDLVNDPQNEFAKILFRGGPMKLCQIINERLGTKYFYNYDEDFCIFCKRMTKIYLKMEMGEKNES